MGFASKLRAALRPAPVAADDGAATNSAPSPPQDFKAAVATDAAAADAVPAINEKGESLSDVPSPDAQHGVQQIEAMTLTWSKRSLYAMFVNIWFLYLTNAFQSAILSSLIPYASSDFQSLPLLSVIYIVGSSMTAATYIPLAKVLDLWGRAEGFLLMASFATLGMVLMAVSHNLPTFCAAYVFYTIGFGGMTYCVDVLTADASQLKNRGLAYAFTSSPYMITAFAGPKSAESFEKHVGWRWGFGIFAILFPIVAAPLFFNIKTNVRQAQKKGTYVRPKSGRTIVQSIWYYLIEFDALGVTLFSVGLTVFLLPFSIAASAHNGWKTGYIIAMIVLGLIMLVVFIIYEKFVAPKPVLNFQLLTDRTVIGACLLDATYQLSYYCWNNLFPQFLQVVNDLSIANAGYVQNTFNVVSGFLLLGVGYSIRRTGYFKWLLYIAVPLYVFTQGLMIYFRRPDQSVGYLVMCQIFISIGGSVFIIVEQLAILAAVDHQHVAAALALLNVVGTVGDGIGATISGAIYTNTFPGALARYLPESAQANLTDIYGDIKVQLSYEVGTETRLAIQKAYGYSQTRMLAAGTGIMVLSFLWIMLIRNINLKKVAQVKGIVF